MKPNDDPELDRLVQEALASRRVPEPPGIDEVELYDEDTGWICLDHLVPEEPEESAEDPNSNPADR